MFLKIRLPFAINKVVITKLTTIFSIINTIPTKLLEELKAFCCFSSTEGDEGGRFSMGVDSGLVTLARWLDHEDQYHYTLTVAVTDGVHTTTTQVCMFMSVHLGLKIKLKCRKHWNHKQLTGISRIISKCIKYFTFVSKSGY